MYPRKEKVGVDRDLRQVLKSVNLEELLKRVENNLDKELDWPDVLSLGEQQRLSFARLLVMEPVMAFLDEATSALDEDNEALIYRLLRESKVSYVSVGHRSTLRAFHDRILILDGAGKWHLENA